MINMNQNHPFYEKYRRAQAGLPPIKHEDKPRAKKVEIPQSTDTGLGPDWAKRTASTHVQDIPIPVRSQPRVRTKRYADIKDKIRAEWQPTPRYPTYDDYLAAKNSNKQSCRRVDTSGMTPDQIAQWGSSTHAWE